MEIPICPLLSSSDRVLVICEKPSVARDLAKVLGGGAPGDGFIPFSGGVISWARGHMLELAPPSDYNPEWKQWRWDTLPMVPEGLRFKSVVKDDCRGQVKILKDLYGDATVLVNACDAGREGELIWWEVVRHCGWGKGKATAELGEMPALRFWAQSNTPDGMREAWEQMRPASERLGLARSAYGRNEADWLLGLNASRAATLSFPAPVVDGKKGFWSVGRVQTPVLALIASRDAEISKFSSRPFYEVRATFQGDSPFEAAVLVPEGVAPFLADEANPPKEVKAFLQRVDADAVLARVLGTKPEGWTVKDESKSGTENPPLLFSLTDLQKWCNQAWGWEAKRTLDAAQAAYETAKTLSYPRTDAAFLPEDAKDKMDEVYRQVRAGFLDGRHQMPSWVVEPSSSARAGYLFDNSKLTDHYAIVPTGIIPGDLNSDSGKVWLAVVRRFFVAFGPPAKTATLKRRLSYGEDVAVASGKRYLDRGWMDADDALCSLTGHSPKADPETLPACGATAPVLDGRLHEGKTTPPKPYTEATLLAVMENIHTKLEEDEEELKEVLSQKGIGTPATRAAIIELLISRSYIVREKKGGSVYLRVTEAGSQLITSLCSVNLAFLTQPAMTAEWEQRLLLMERGSGDSLDKFLGDLIGVVESLVAILKKDAVSSGTSVERKATEGICPLSGEPVLDAGGFWEFPGFPGVRFYKELSGRTFSLEEMVSILEGASKEFSGFHSKKTGKDFSAGLVYDPGTRRLKFVFSDAPVSKDSGELCPISGDPIRDCGGFWEFPGREGKFWKTMCKRSMRLSEYSELVEKGKTKSLDGFVSNKTGNTFSAYLVLKEDGSVGFEFAPRGPGSPPISPKMTGPGKKGAVAKDPKKKKKTW